MEPVVCVAWTDTVVADADACGPCEDGMIVEGPAGTGMVVEEQNVSRWELHPVDGVDTLPTLSVEHVPPPVTPSTDDATPRVADSVVVPDLQPVTDDQRDDVQPTAAVEEAAMQPEAEPAAVGETAAPLEPAVAPAEPNLFEEADRTDELDQGPSDAVPAPPSDTPSADDDPEPMPESADAAVPPADEPAPPAENPLDAAARRSGEEARLWIDATGRHAVVGVLVEVRVDGRCVIDTGAGVLEVRSVDLRRRDRDYAAQAADRLAARRGPAPAETAGR